MKNIWTNFKATIIFAVVALLLSFFWGFFHGPSAGLEQALNLLAITAILGVMELSLSLDNAVVNASILKHWSPFWQKMFLTVGIVVAVFGMRLVFPIIIVSGSTGLGVVEVFTLALNEPVAYSAALMENYSAITAFGGIFLWLVFANFLFDSERDVHWCGKLERIFGRLGEVNGLNYTSAILLLLVLCMVIPDAEQGAVFNAGIIGLMTYALVDLIGFALSLLSSDEEEGKANGEVTKNIVKGGIGGFIYIELIDASFSFDGVVASFAITSDIIVIMLGLAIGAMAVRCLTVYLVREGTLSEYRYLEHGAMYAIGILALLLMSSSFIHLPELVTGLIGVVLIGTSFYHSVRENRKEALKENSGS